MSLRTLILGSLLGFSAGFAVSPLGGIASSSSAAPSIVMRVPGLLAGADDDQGFYPPCVQAKGPRMSLGAVTELPECAHAKRVAKPGKCIFRGDACSPNGRCKVNSAKCSVNHKSI